MAAAAANSSSDLSSDGPVLNLINKRLRALRKKLNRISQMEDALSQGKTLNKEQEETLRSKSAVLSGIDELDKLRQPLAQAVQQEIEIALNSNSKDDKSETLASAADEEESKPDEVKESGDVSELLQLIYFGSVFDVRTLMRAHENMLTRTHERNCCLTYDYVTDDDSAGEPLKEWDLDLISMLGGLLVSRPVDSSLSHKIALEKCVEHAKLWLANSEQHIDPNLNITYAGLREKLNKIMASEYFTTTPQIKAPVEVAAAAGNYTTFQMPVHGSVNAPVNVIVPIEGSASQYQQQEEQSPNSHGNEIYGDETGLVEELHQRESEVENTSETHNQNELGAPDTEVDQNSRDVELNEQQYGNRRSYQNYRGGRGGNGGGRRGYGNNRGGRGGNRGGYQNGRGQFYDQPGGYYPRNSNYRGRGGRGGMGGNYGYHASAGHASHAQEAS